MIILHRKCDRIVRSSRPVIAESLYHGVFFCLPLFGKKVAELCCTNVCKTDKNSKKHLSNFSKYSIHLKHSKHPFVQKIALYRAKMTANLQNENGPLWGPFYFSLNSVEAHFAPKMRNRSRDPHYAPKGVADFAARRRQIILIINRRDMRVAIYSSRAAVHRRGTIPAPFRARQSCHFLETGSLHPPPAALRRFPCAPAARALQRSASPSKKRGRRKPSSFFEVFRQALR